MRARLIKPGYFKNDELAMLPPLARILFPGLWCLADRAGRLEDRPLRIKAEVLPYDDCDCDALLDALAGAGFIARYRAGGQRFIQVLNFDRHQTPHIKEPASTIPAPCEHGASPMLAPTGDISRTGLEPDEHSLNPSVPTIPDTDTEADPEAEHSRASNGRRKPEEVATYEPLLFARLWGFYGKHGSVDKAAKEWDALRPSRDFMQAIRRAIEDQRDAYGWGEDGGQAQPHLSTWLHQRRWEWEAVPNKVRAER